MVWRVYLLAKVTSSEEWRRPGINLLPIWTGFSTCFGTWRILKGKRPHDFEAVKYLRPIRSLKTKAAASFHQQSSAQSRLNLIWSVCLAKSTAAAQRPDPPHLTEKPYSYLATTANPETLASWKMSNLSRTRTDRRPWCKRRSPSCWDSTTYQLINPALKNYGSKKNFCWIFKLNISSQGWNIWSTSNSSFRIRVAISWKFSTRSMNSLLMSLIISILHAKRQLIVGANKVLQMKLVWLSTLSLWKICMKRPYRGLRRSICSRWSPVFSPPKSSYLHPKILIAPKKRYSVLETPFWRGLASNGLISSPHASVWIATTASSKTTSKEWTTISSWTSCYQPWSPQQARPSRPKSCPHFSTTAELRLPWWQPADHRY